MSSIFTGTVYKIVCSLDENIIYIGSTFNQLRHRWQTHKCHYKSYLERKTRCVSIYPYFEKFGIENFKIMKIKDYKCYREHNKDSKHLHTFEQLWINKTRCINKQAAFSIPMVAIEKLKEQRKKYREENSEKIKEQNKKYYQVNKEKISEYHKEYQNINKEKISEYNQANREKKSEYQKEYYQTNKEKISERNKKYQNINKEKISEYKKEWREANREKISEKRKERVNCTICNKDLAKCSLTRHKKRFHPS